MPTVSHALLTSETPFSGGLNAVAGLGSEEQVDVTGAWNVGDIYGLVLTDSSTGLQVSIGDGYVTGVEPTYTLTFNNKVYVLAGNTVYMSAIGDPTTWNDPNASGNGFISIVNWYSSAENITAMAIYQGMLAFFSRQTVYIWTTATNIANWSITQTLPNIGIVAPNTAQSLGDLDVIFLSDTGYRSLRARDITLNAFINDLGSPIDQIVQSSLLANLEANNVLACSGVEPLSGRYMSCLNGVIYVLSYYPSNKIQAWSTYTPVDNLGKPFTPLSIKVYNGQLWFYGVDSNNVPAAYQYGGADNVTYDTTKPKFQTGFLDAKTPGTIKTARAVDIACNVAAGGAPLKLPDTWKIYCSMDEKAAGDPTKLPDPTQVGWTQVYTSNNSSFDILSIPYSDAGTHFSICGIGQGNGNGGQGGPATFSEALLHYDAANEKG